MRFSEVISLLDREGYGFATTWQSQQLHNTIGHSYIERKYKGQGSGNPIDYDDRDIRRAVAGCRLRSIMGTPNNTVGTRVIETVVEVACRHDSGFAAYADGTVGWFAFPEDIDTSTLGTGLLLVSCWVGSLSSSETATLAEEAEED